MNLDPALITAVRNGEPIDKFSLHYVLQDAWVRLLTRPTFKAGVSR
jgi:hypothetical protein